MMSMRVRHAALVAFTAAALPRGAACAQDAGEKEDVKAREEWFWAARSYPFNTRPYLAMSLARLAAMSGQNARASMSTMPLLGGSWRPLGPYGFFGSSGSFGSAPQLDAGRVTAIAPSPVAGGPLIIGTASGGVWRSTTLGANWTPVTDNQCSLTTGAVAVDPVTPSIVYAATGEYNVFSFGCGVLRSLDGGVTWTASTSGLSLTNGASAIFGSLLIDRATAGSATSTVIVGATAEGLVRSVNSGSSWTLRLAGSPSSLVSTRPGTMFVGMTDFTTATRSGVWKSTNAGIDWTQLPTLPGVDVTKVGRVELAVSPAAPDRVYAIVANGKDRKFTGLFVWDDLQASWSQVGAAGLYSGAARGDFGAQADYDFAVAVDPRDARRIYIAGVRAYRSVDGGATFTTMATEVHSDWHQIVIDPRNPDILYAGTDGGVFVSADAGDTWTSKNAGLTIIQYYPGISVSAQGSYIAGGSQDNGTELFSGSQFWDGFNGGDGGYTAIHPTNPVIQYSESQWSTTTGPFIVRRDATTNRTRNVGIDITDRAQFIPPLIMDPVTPTTLYFGTNKLYKTVDEAATWTALTADLSKGTGTIRTIAVAPSDALTIYVGTSDGLVQVSRDGGATLFVNQSVGLPTRTVNRIVIDPADATHALATFSGYGTGHVFETTNAGVAWKDISGNLGNAPANAAVFVGSAANIFVGTDVGVFQTIDGGVTWQPGPSGMPNVIIQDLIYQPAGNLLVAGTYGRGMFSYVVGGQSAVLRGDANGDGKVDAFDALLIQQALVGTASLGASIYPRGDANCNGVLDSADAMLVLRAAVGLSTTGTCVGTTK
jgi:hypothetical protein